MSHRNDIHDDDSSFNDYLKRGSTLSKRYSESARDNVPPELDEKILAQAREAVGDKKVVTHASWWIKWNKPLALAATLILAFTVMYRVGHQSIDELAAPAPTTSMTTMTDKSSQSIIVATAPADKRNETATSNAPMEKSLLKEPAAEKPAQPLAPPAADTTSELSKAKRETLPSLAVPMPAQAPVTVISGEATASANASNELKKSGGNGNQVSTTDSTHGEDIGKFPDARVAESLSRTPSAADRSAMEAEAATKIETQAVSRERAAGALASTSSADKKEQDVKSNAEIALQHIRELRQRGRQQEADRAWQQFVKDFPDYPVKDDDVARSIKK